MNRALILLCLLLWGCNGAAAIGPDGGTPPPTNPPPTSPPPANPPPTNPPPTNPPPTGPTYNFVDCNKKRESNHVIIVTGEAVTAFANGDVLYVFTPDGICAGESLPFDGKNFPVVAWGDDIITTAKDGFTSQEDFVFVLKHPEVEAPVEVAVSASEGPLKYAPDGITVVTAVELE